MMRLMNVFVPIVLLWNIINCMTNFSLTWAFQFPSSSSSITASKTTSSFLIQHKQKDNLLITSRFQSFPHQIQKRRTLLYNNQDDITTTSTTKTTTTKLDESQIDFIMGYMNKHHTNVLIKFTQVFTSLGEIQMKKNAFSGGSYEIVDAKLVGIYFDADTGACENNDNTESGNYLELEATVQIWGKKETTVEVVQVSLGKTFLEEIHIILVHIHAHYLITCIGYGILIYDLNNIIYHVHVYNIQHTIQ